MNHEQDRERDQAHEAEAKSSDKSVPGRRSTSAGLDGPEHPVASGILMRHGDGNVSDASEAAVANASGKSGQALPTPLREKFETSLGTDLGDVRVHTGAESHVAAEAVGANAYAMGNDIHFGAGQYDPGSEAGQHLIAHEVAHTVQQRGGSKVRQNKLAITSPGDKSEVEADRAADAMVKGASFALGSSSPMLARNGKKEPHDLTADDKNRLANARQLIDKAKANISAANAALTAYASTAPGLFAQMQATFDANKQVYLRCQQIVNRVISTSKETQAVGHEVLVTLLNAALGPIVSKIAVSAASSNQFMHALDAATQAEVVAMKSASDLSVFGEVLGDLPGEGQGAAIDAAKKGATATGGPSVAGGPDEVAFLAQLLSLRGAADGITRGALRIARLGAPFGSAATYIQVMIDSNRTQKGKDAAGVERDAANVWNGSSGLVAVAPRAAALAAELRAVAAQTVAITPKNDLEIEKELWVKWAAQLRQDDLSTMDLTAVANHCKAIGIWDQLGIDPTGWFKMDADKAMAVASAYAQSKVLAHKGTGVDVDLTDGYADEQIQLPGLPPLRAKVEGATKVVGVQSQPKKAKAVVVNAVAAMAVDKSILEKTARTKEAVAEYLLKHSYITVILRVYQDPEAVQEPSKEPENQPTPEPTPDFDEDGDPGVRKGQTSVTRLE